MVVEDGKAGYSCAKKLGKKNGKNGVTSCIVNSRNGEYLIESLNPSELRKDRTEVTIR